MNFIQAVALGLIEIDPTKPEEHLEFTEEMAKHGFTHQGTFAGGFMSFGHFFGTTSYSQLPLYVARWACQQKDWTLDE